MDETVRAAQQRLEAKEPEKITVGVFSENELAYVAKISAEECESVISISKETLKRGQMLSGSRKFEDQYIVENAAEFAVRELFEKICDARESGPWAIPSWYKKLIPQIVRESVLRFREFSGK